MRAAFQVVVCLSVLAFGCATLGVDVSQPTSASAFKCLVQSGHTFTIVRVYQSNGRVDPHGAQTIANAWAGGMQHVDGYIFPCPQCGNPAGQMTDAIRSLAGDSAANATKYGMLWVDVEDASLWSANHAANVAFLQTMVHTAQQMGVHVGIYTSAYQWGGIGGTSPALAGLPLWYSHYDDSPSFSDWRAFAGWQHPAIKQYRGTTSVCGASVDLNFY